MSEDYIRLKRDQFLCQFLDPSTGWRIAVVSAEIATFHPA
jgi:hypothetical protein